WEGMKKLHALTVMFLDWHGMSISHDKSILIGRRSSDGTDLADSLPLPDGKIISPSNPSCPFRYLGVMLNMDLDWSAQIIKCTKVICSFTAQARTCRFSLAHLRVTIKQVL